MSPLYALSALALDFTRIITFSIFFKICSFIILLFKWFVIVERRFLPAPLARMCIFAPRFIFIVLTTWLTPYSYYGLHPVSFSRRKLLRYLCQLTTHFGQLSLIGYTSRGIQLLYPRWEISNHSSSPTTSSDNSGTRPTMPTRQNMNYDFFIPGTKDIIPSLQVTRPIPVTSVLHQLSPALIEEIFLSRCTATISYLYTCLISFGIVVALCSLATLDGISRPPFCITTDSFAEYPSRFLAISPLRENKFSLGVKPTTHYKVCQIVWENSGTTARARKIIRA